MIQNPLIPFLTRLIRTDHLFVLQSGEYSINLLSYFRVLILRENIYSVIPTKKYLLCYSYEETSPVLFLRANISIVISITCSFFKVANIRSSLFLFSSNGKFKEAGHLYSYRTPIQLPDTFKFRELIQFPCVRIITVYENCVFTLNILFK